MLRLLNAELKRAWITYLRYPMDSWSSLGMMLVTFYVLVAGARYIAGPTMAAGDRLDSVILGYWLWNLAVIAFSATATAVHLDALSGTLEQLFLSPFGPLKVFLARSLSSLGINLVTSTVLLAVLLLITGRRLSFPPLLIAPLTTLLVATYGIGFIAAGLAVLFKQITQFLAILQFILLPLVLVPLEAFGTFGIGQYFLPLVPSAALLRSLMARQELPPAWSFLLAAINSIVYFMVGVFLFHVADRQARLRGMLGQH